MLSRGIDTDNFDGPVSTGRFRHLKDKYGVQFVIIGCQVGVDGANYTNAQKQSALDAGLLVPAHYEFLYWDDHDLGRIRRAASFGLPVWLDCEAYTTWSPSAVVSRIQEAKELLQSTGQYAGIYTGAWWWAATGNTNQFAGDPCWLASYTYKGLPPQDYLPNPRDLAAPGGMVAKVWQYADTCYDEPGFDMNSMEVEVPDSVQPSADQLRLAAVQAMLTKYDFRVTGTNIFQQTVVQLMEKNGQPADPPSFLALEVSK